MIHIVYFLVEIKLAKNRIQQICEKTRRSVGKKHWDDSYIKKTQTKRPDQYSKTQTTQTCHVDYNINPTGTRRNNNIVMMSKRRHDVVLTS